MPADKTNQGSAFPTTHWTLVQVLQEGTDEEAGDDQFVVILDADTLEEKHRFLAHDGAVTALRFHPSEPILATGSADHSVKVWDYARAEVKETFLGLGGRPVALSFSPDGGLLAVEGMEKAFRIFAVGE